MLGAAVAVPATVGFAGYLGALAFREPLPVTYSLPPAVAWCLLTFAGAALATTGAARAASRLTVRDALATV